jgi:signal transduction histidine kinase
MTFNQTFKKHGVATNDRVKNRQIQKNSQTALIFILETILFHEINTPLHSILGSINILMDDTIGLENKILLLRGN